VAWVAAAPAVVARVVPAMAVGSAMAAVPEASGPVDWVGMLEVGVTVEAAARGTAPADRAVAVTPVAATLSVAGQEGRFH